MPDPVSTEFAQWLVTLGVGGALAAFMFVFYRKDIKAYTELWKAQAELNRSSTDHMITVIKENTVSNTRLIALLENVERNSIRKQDIENLIEARFAQVKFSHSRTQDNPAT